MDANFYRRYWRMGYAVLQFSGDMRKLFTHKLRSFGKMSAEEQEDELRQTERLAKGEKSWTDI